MRRLVFDVETSPPLIEAFLPLKGPYIAHSQIVRESEMMCFSAKWYGSKKVEFRSTFHDGRELMVRRLWHLLDEADVVIDYYGRGVDIPRSRQEFLKLGLGPPSPFLELDLYKTVKQFGFPSNSLAYALKFLGLEGKVTHEGQKLWRDCLAGDPRAWAKMKRYSMRDVTGLEEVHDALIPWITGYPNHSAFSDGMMVCTRCGSSRLQKRGTSTKRSVRYQRYQCTGCGGWMTGTSRLSSAKLIEEV